LICLARHGLRGLPLGRSGPPGDVRDNSVDAMRISSNGPAGIFELIPTYPENNYGE